MTEIVDESHRTSGRSGVCCYLDQLDIAPGRTGFTRPKLRLSALLRAGDVVPVQYRLTDDLGNTWDFAFPVTVE